MKFARCIDYTYMDPCSVVVNHAGLWIRRRQFESAQGYSRFQVLILKILFIVTPLPRLISVKENSLQAARLHKWTIYFIM